MRRRRGHEFQARLNVLFVARAARRRAHARDEAVELRTAALGHIYLYLLYYYWIGISAKNDHPITTVITGEEGIKVTYQRHDRFVCPLR